MVYYKVKPEADNKRKPTKKSYEIYISNELYTETEVKKQNLNLAYLDKIEVSKKNIHWFFGARFQNL